MKRFFNEKEVTSTLVMDALYCGCKLLEQAGRRFLDGAGAASCGSCGGDAAPALPNGGAAQQQEQQPADGSSQEQQPAEGAPAQEPAAAAEQQQPGEPAGVLIDARRGSFFFAGDAVRCAARMPAPRFVLCGRVGACIG